MKLRLASPALFALSFAAVLPLQAAPKKVALTKNGQQAAGASAAVSGWLHWRGPNQNGTTNETGLPEKVDANQALWTADFPGQSSPVIANGKLYINGYVGDGQELQEAIRCYDAETGKMLWEHRFNDFLSDTIYRRYATSSPTIDPETGNVYMQGTQGIFACFTGDGKLLWEHSMMEEFGRMTFPNARTASPVIDKELVITRGITSNWGAHGPAADRFYAFDKKTGELVWSSSPGERPQDNTFSPPYMTWIDGKRVLISAAGDSSVLGINARTGDPLFRFPAAKAGAKGGINAGVLRYDDSLLVIHESENIDSSEVGRTARFRLPQTFKPAEPNKPQQFTAKELEMWRNPLGTLASSPALVGKRLYIVTGIGEVAAVDVESGKILWRKKLAPEQRQSSPFYAEGRLYVGLYTAPGQAGGAATEGAPASNATDTGGHGELLVLKPTDTDAEILSRTVLEGRCYGSPIGFNGKLYIQTDRKLYCFGKKGANPGLPAPAAEQEWPKPAVAAKLQIIPSEIRLRPGQSVNVRVRSLDANGFTVEEKVDPSKVTIESYIPPTALVKSSMKGTYADGKITADKERSPSAGAFMAKLGELSGVMRGRVLVDAPLNQDFESFDLNQVTGPGPGGAPVVDEPDPASGKTAAPVQPGPTNWNVVEPPTPFAYPPLPWNSARFKFEIRKAPGEGENKALVKTIDNKRFQRGMVFIGHPEESNYTMEADVLTEGNRRKMSEIGLINQRYLIAIKGNAQQIEVSSNQELLRQSVPFKCQPNTWYRLKTRVDVNPDGTGVVRGKAWKKGEPEPEAWNIEVADKNVNKQGSPGVYSLAPQEQRAWIDNISVVANK